jgi:FdhD protein
MKNFPMPARPVKEVAVRRMNGSAIRQDKDFLAAEEPLEIRVEGHSVAIVMRTPGEDRELAAGFLVTEGMVHSAGDLIDIKYQSHCWFPAGKGSGQRADARGVVPGKVISRTGPETNGAHSNVINVQLKNPESMDLKKLTRHVFTSSSCGICSKASIEAVRQQFPPIKDDFEVDPQVLFGLPDALSSAQETFKRTGGLHACALFDAAGNLLVLREDVGRHNALDKVIGWAVLKNRLPLRQHILLLSGRTSFEMMQKALAAGIPIVAAISAPSGLAAEFARDSGQTLIGFLRGEKMNIYSGEERLRPIAPSQTRIPTTAF